MQQVIEIIKNKKEQIHEWLNSYEGTQELPLYSSVDIRDSGFKMAVVDTNLFPAGFNNLCEHGLEDSVHFMREAVLERVKDCRNILIIAEEHTRNTWYLENIRILQQIIERAGFQCKTATFLHVDPIFCENANFVELETAAGTPIKIYCFRKILKMIQEEKEHFDLVIMNNDLTTGIPETLREMNAPIYPSIQAGWHSRLKSYHFHHTADLIQEFANIVGLDPWLFSSYFSVIDNININDESNRVRLTDQAADLFSKIQMKYKEHHIDEKPYIVIKSNSGTYGMGVLPVEDPSEIAQLNRKNRNRLYKGKGARVIESFLLQEGIPTIYNIDQKVSEVVIYQIAQNLVGGFYRSHKEKGKRENLNAQGMDFVKMCPHQDKYGDCDLCGIRHDINIFDVYRVLARIACIAAHREILHLETVKK